MNTIPKITTTPWDRPDDVTFLNKEHTVLRVSTPSHGGIGVHKSQQMPTHLANGIDEGGFLWYEEDCHWSLVVLAFPDLFEERVRESAKTTAANWYPDEYMAHFGVTLSIEQSSTLAQRDRDLRLANKFTVSSAFSDTTWNVPKGFVYASGYRKSDGAHQGFLVPKEQYVNPHELVLDDYPQWSPDKSFPYMKAAETTPAAS